MYGGNDYDDYDTDLHDAAEDPLQRLYRLIVDDANLPPTVVYKSDSDFRIVLPGFIESDADRASNKPVLVSFFAI